MHAHVCRHGFLSCDLLLAGWAHEPKVMAAITDSLHLHNAAHSRGDLVLSHFRGLVGFHDQWWLCVHAQNQINKVDCPPRRQLSDSCSHSQSNMSQDYLRMTTAQAMGFAATARDYQEDKRTLRQQRSECLRKLCEASVVAPVTCRGAPRHS